MVAERKLVVDWGRMYNCTGSSDSSLSNALVVKIERRDVLTFTSPWSILNLSLFIAYEMSS